MNIKNKNVTTFFIFKDLSISNKIELKRLSNKSHSFDLITGNLIKDESLEDTFIHEDKNSFTNFFLLSDLQIINKTELKKTMITSHFFNLISGEIIKECPKVFLPFQCKPLWAGAKIKQKFSIALALRRLCQCFLPVVCANADGMEINKEPLFESFLYIFGNLKS